MGSGWGIEVRPGGVHQAGPGAEGHEEWEAWEAYTGGKPGTCNPQQAALRVSVSSILTLLGIAVGTPGSPGRPLTAKKKPKPVPLHVSPQQTSADP